MMTFPFEEPTNDNFELWDSWRDSGPWAFVELGGFWAVVLRDFADVLSNRVDWLIGVEGDHDELTTTIESPKPPATPQHLRAGRKDRGAAIDW